MMSDETSDADRGHEASRPRRRARYRGTHPRRFEERYKELHPEKYPDMAAHIRSQGRTPAGTHVPVLVAEAMDVLRPASGDVVVDCTIGYGGHAEAFLERIGPTGRLIGLDVDAEQLRRTRARLAAHAGVLRLHHGNFAGIGKALDAEGLEGCDILFADLGVSSMQIDDPARGFSYKHDGPLDMRMDLRRRRTAADLLASLKEAEIAAALRDLADEPDHDRIARAIAERRAAKRIERTSELVAIVLAAKGLPRRWRSEAGALHPAALTFQALRMLVNDELGALAELLRVAPFRLKPGGRLGIISFHSGEDRLVKKALREGRLAGVYESVSDKPIRPTPEERCANLRSSPAKLRWARKERG